MHEIELAYGRYRAELGHIRRTGEHGRYADLLTSDAVYRRVGQRECRGREAIRAMVLTTGSTAPGELVAREEVLWHAVDLERGRVVHELRHTMCDPGDGSQHVALATELLTYGGEGLWSAVDVVHAPQAYRTMHRSWARAAQRCGRELDPALLMLLEDRDDHLAPPSPDTP